MREKAHIAAAQADTEEEAPFSSSHKKKTGRTPITAKTDPNKNNEEDRTQRGG